MGLFSSKKPKVAPLVAQPTTVTTGYGTGTYNPATGQVGYTLADPLAQMRDIFYGASQEFLPTAEQQQYAQQVGDYGRGLFTGATQYSIPELTSQYYNRQQEILAPERAMESARLADNMFASGRLGYGTGTEGGYINPQQYALQKARESANAQLALNAEDRARAIQAQDIKQGLGLLDVESALRMNPYAQATTLFGTGTGIEGLGYGMLPTVGNFATTQANWQKALQANQQEMNNAKASGGLGGLFGGIGQAVSGLTNVFGKGWGSDLLNAGASWYTGGLSGATGMAGGVGKEAWMYSDINLKTDIKKIGKYKNGLNKYSFTYIWGQPSEGVLAQEVLKVIPEAVTVENGFYKVNYDLIGE